MTLTTVTVLELIAWELDAYSHRNSAANLKEKIRHAKEKLAKRRCDEARNALLDIESKNIKHLFSVYEQRMDLHQEYMGLDWMLGVVDLRHLLAFQRRLVFDPALDSQPTPNKDNWESLLALSFGPPRKTAHTITVNQISEERLDINLHSSNPDLEVRLPARAAHDDASPLALYGGSPFLEVAEFRGRWFLRDGYHRAYKLLQAGVYQTAAVVIHAKTIEELGAVHPYFFNVDQLFSERSPRVADFMNEDLVISYKRARLRKTIRIRIEELLQPFDEIEEIQGD